MDGTSTALERAFALARSGTCLGIADIKKRLAEEGHAINQIDGPALQRQLRELCNAARESTPKGSY
jgi:hypothetical protein